VVFVFVFVFFFVHSARARKKKKKKKKKKEGSIGGSIDGSGGAGARGRVALVPGLGWHQRHPGGVPPVATRQGASAPLDGDPVSIRLHPAGGPRLSPVDANFDFTELLEAPNSALSRPVVKPGLLGDSAHRWPALAVIVRGVGQGEEDEKVAPSRT
jgi:hypothetical protein